MKHLAPNRLIVLGVLASALAGAGVAGDAGTQSLRAEGPNPAKCPARWTLDPVRGDCIRCPPNYRPTFLPLDAAACARTAAIGYSKATQHRRGTGLFGLNCPAGQFRDWNGFCYSCPPDYIRTATGIRDPAACARPDLPAVSPATGRTSACPAGAFRDIGRGDCWKCPGNSIRTAAPVDSDTACSTSVTGILGVNPRGLCGDVLAALNEGGAALDRLKKTVEDLVSPLMTPLNNGLQQLATQVRTPAEFDRLLDRARPHMRPYRAAFEGLSSLTERVSKVRDDLDRLMLDPAVTCDGDFARLDRALISLGLGPGVRTGATAWPDFYALAHTLDIITPSVVRITVSLASVTNLADHHGLFLSVGLAAAPKEPGAGIEVSRSFLGFWDAEFSDFSGKTVLFGVVRVGAMSAEINMSAGEQVTDFFGRLRRMAWYPQQPPPSLAPLFIPDGITWAFDPESIVKGPFVWGLGPSWTPIHKNWRPPKRDAATTSKKLWVAPGASFDASWLLFGR